VPKKKQQKTPAEPRPPNFGRRTGGGMTKQKISKSPRILKTGKVADIFAATPRRSSGGGRGGGGGGWVCGGGWGGGLSTNPDWELYGNKGMS